MKLFLILSAIVLASIQAKAAAGDEYVIVPSIVPYGDYTTAEIKPGVTAIGKPWAILRTNSASLGHSQTVASITSQVVTNTTSGDNHSGCSTCDSIRKYHYAVYHECNIQGPYVPATERWTTWTVTQERSYTLYDFEIEKTLTFWHSTPITNWTVRETIKLEWVPVPTPPPQQQTEAMTNVMSLSATNKLDVSGGGFQPADFDRYSVVNTNLLKDLEAMIERIMNAKITNQGSAK